MGTVYSVSQVNSYLKSLISKDGLLRSISIRGELSNVKYHTSGHIYFTLKDDRAAISGVMFAANAYALKIRLKDGMKVVAEGGINVYEKTGVYQIYATAIRQEGSGELYERFLKLKEDLEERGMFDPGYKKEIPAYINRLGVVTARTGAAVRDIINIAKRRDPFIEIILYPAKVQGEGAAQTIAEGIRALDGYGVDTIIIGRGGGSIEDLWAFNEEITAQAVFDCKTPVISAVGHETDFAITDFVADLRAPTPSAAAELAVFDYADLAEKTEKCRMTMTSAMHLRIRNDRNRLENLAVRLKSKSPAGQMNEKRLRLDGYYDGIINAMSIKLQRYNSRLELYREKLNGADPQGRLKSGYAFVEGADGKPVKDVTGLCEGDTLKLIMKNGKVYTDVRRIEENKDEH
ncbi:MAG: exodeoxyribonuclease VII large subunit [Lachnospiraceae bacterium]|nr:exodeoxyribonuclease VII large subunit [Lachnospiraceae bacterium]